VKTRYCGSRKRNIVHGVYTHRHCPNRDRLRCSMARRTVPCPIIGHSRTAAQVACFTTMSTCMVLLKGSWSKAKIARISSHGQLCSSRGLLCSGKCMVSVVVQRLGTRNGSNVRISATVDFETNRTSQQKRIGHVTAMMHKPRNSQNPIPDLIQG
jgi:hypothetical protein